MQFLLLGSIFNTILQARSTEEWSVRTVFLSATQLNRLCLRSVRESVNPCIPESNSRSAITSAGPFP